MSLTVCLWFPGTMHQAIDFYVDLFPDSSRGSALEREGRVIAADWTMLGQSFRAIDGPDQDFAFNQAASLSVSCADQAEVDRYWNALTGDGGEEGPCGWCRDRFGLWWQVVPEALDRLNADPDPARAAAAFEAMLTMKKLVIADLVAAADAVG